MSHVLSTSSFLPSVSCKQDGLHAEHITLSYTHQGQRIQAELLRNDRLLPDAHFLRYQNASNLADGATGYVVRNFTKTDVDLCHYQVSVCPVWGVTVCVTP